MALPPGGIPDTPEGDKKRLMQRADNFAIGRGTRDKSETDEIDEFDETMESVVRRAKKVDKEAETQSRELAEHREDQALREAERRGSSSPSHQPFLGLSVLPGIPNQSMTVGHTPESHSKRRSTGVEETGAEQVVAVSQELIQGLRNSGLEQPIITLNDPRLSGNIDALGEQFTLSLQGHERVYVWDQNSCHQVLSVGLHETRLESAVGTTVETLVRRGKVDKKETRKRTVSNDTFEVNDHG